MRTHHSREESTFSSQRWSGQGLQVFSVSLWLGDLSWDNVELTKIFSALFSSPKQQNRVNLDSKGVKLLAGSSEYRREYLKHPLNGSGDPDLERWIFPWQVLDCLGFKNEVYPTKPSRFGYKNLEILEVLNGSQMLEELQQWNSSWLSWPKCLVESPSYYFAAMVQWFQLARSRDFAHRARTWQSSCTQAGVKSWEHFFKHTDASYCFFWTMGSGQTYRADLFLIFLSTIFFRHFLVLNCASTKAGTLAVLLGPIGMPAAQ